MEENGTEILLTPMDKDEIQDGYDIKFKPAQILYGYQ